MNQAQNDMPDVGRETFTVGDLREALGDDSREPRYVAGIRGRGYRLAADVARAPKPAPPVEAAEPEAPSVTPRNASDRIAAASQARGGLSRHGLRKWLWVSALLAIVPAFPIMLWVNRSRSTNVPVATEIQQPASSPVGTRAGTVAVLPFENRSADAIGLLRFSGWIGPRAADWQFVLGIGMSCAVTALPILILFMEKLQIHRRPGISPPDAPLTGKRLLVCGADLAAVMRVGRRERVR